MNLLTIMSTTYTALGYHLPNSNQMSSCTSLRVLLINLCLDLACAVTPVNKIYNPVLKCNAKKRFIQLPSFVIEMKVNVPHESQFGCWKREWKQ